MKERYYYDSEEATRDITESIIKASKLCSKFDTTKRPIIICVGTDRSSGDSLGPRVGQYLKALKDLNAQVIGDIDNPVHATNLETTLSMIPTDAPKIIVDASLGAETSVGAIIISDDGMAPGTGVDKQLEKLDGIGIKGVVNVMATESICALGDDVLTSKSSINSLILNCTKLSVVEAIARVIANAIAYSLTEV